MNLRPTMDRPYHSVKRKGTLSSKGSFHRSLVLKRVSTALESISSLESGGRVYEDAGFTALPIDH